MMEPQLCALWQNARKERLHNEARCTLGTEHVYASNQLAPKGGKHDGHTMGHSQPEAFVGPKRRDNLHTTSLAQPKK